MLTHALIALAAFGPTTDTPIEPIPASMIEVVVTTEAMQETCALYGQVIPLFSDALGGDRQLALDVTDAYAISMFEAGWDEDGSARMTAEAREVFTEYLHGCAL